MKHKSYFLTHVYAYNNGGWKLDDDGNIELKDGNPVYVDSSGREMTLRADAISQANADAKAQREAKEELEKKLKVYDGLDADKAREALNKIKDIDLSKMVDAGELDKVKHEIQKEYEVKLSEKETHAKTLQQRLDDMYVNSVFSSSEFVQNSLAVPRDMFEATFKSNFKVEEGKVVAYDKSGNRLMSKENIGEYASPDEALRLLVDAHPQKETIIRADVGSGTGSNGGGANRGIGRTMKVAEFDKLLPSKQAEIAAKVGSGEMTLTD